MNKKYNFSFYRFLITRNLILIATLFILQAIIYIFVRSVYEAGDWPDFVFSVLYALPFLAVLLIVYRVIRYASEKMFQATTSQLSKTETLIISAFLYLISITISTSMTILIFNNSESIDYRWPFFKSIVAVSIVLMAIFDYFGNRYTKKMFKKEERKEKGGIFEV